LRWGIISDIHGNLEALEAVLESIRSAGVDKIICLGDIVGYGADPNRCTDIIRERVEFAVIGNHDHAALGLTSVAYFNQYAREAALWTSRELNQENRDYLLGLAFEVKQDGALFVHSTPENPEEWNYIFSYYEARYHFTKFEEQVCFIGHSHVPVRFNEEGSARRIINVGSVGQPRDHNPKSCYYIYDSETNEGDWVRVEYDIQKAADKIRNAGLPRILADRLFKGM